MSNEPVKIETEQEYFNRKVRCEKCSDATSWALVLKPKPESPSWFGPDHRIVVCVCGEQYNVYLTDVQ